MVIPDAGALGKAELRSIDGKLIGERDLKDGLARFVLLTAGVRT